MKKLAIVTTTYNQEQFIAKTIESIINQKTSFSFELVISDDCSVDGTRDILANYQNKYPEKIKVILQDKNLGAMQNYINTLNSITAEYVAICDGDDYWTDENKLEKQVNFLDQNPDFSICFHQTKICYEDGSAEDSISPLNVNEVTTFNELVKENYIPANAVMYRWGFNNEIKFADVFPKDVVPGDYFTHLWHARMGNIKFIPEVMSYYRRHDKGFWWLTANGGDESGFIAKFGIKYLRFIVAIEKEFKLEESQYESTKLYLMNRLVKYYLVNEKFEFMNQLFELFPKGYKIVINDMLSTAKDTSNYYEIKGNGFNKVEKLLFMICFDRRKLLNAIKNKIFKKVNND